MSLLPTTGWPTHLLRLEDVVLKSMGLQTCAEVYVSGHSMGLCTLEKSLPREMREARAPKFLA